MRRNRAPKASRRYHTDPSGPIQRPWGSGTDADAGNRFPMPWSRVSGPTTFTLATRQRLPRPLTGPGKVPMSSNSP